MDGRGVSVYISILYLAMVVVITEAILQLR